MSKVISKYYVFLLIISIFPIGCQTRSELNVIEITPDTNFTVDGINYAAGESLVLHPKTGKVLEGVLAEETVVNGYALQADHKVFFYEDGSLEGGYLSEGTVFEDLLITNGHFSLYPTGELQSGNLASDIELDGVVYRGQSQIYLYESGKVRGGYLLTNTIISGMIFQAADGIIPDIYFYEKGLVEMGILNYYTAIDNHYYIGFVRFYESGEVAEGYFVFDTQYEDYKFMKGKKVSFHENGKIKSATLSKAIEIDGIEYEKGTKVIFDQRGNFIGTDE